MAVGPVRPMGLSGVAPGRLRRTASGFALPQDTADAAAGAAIAATSGTGSLLAVQDAGGAAPPEPPAQCAERRAGQALHELRGLQLDLLRDGPADPTRRQRLQDLAAAPDPATESGLDPALAALLAELRLRARLELARQVIPAPSSI